MVRLWTPGSDGWLPGMRGTATHIASGKHVTFTEVAGLIEFLSGAAASSPRRPADEAQPPNSSIDHTRL